MDNKNKLLVLSRDSGNYAQLVKELAFDGLDIVHADSPSHAETYLNKCNIILGEPSKIAPVIHSAGRLVWVQSTWAGVNELVKPDMRTDYTLTGVKGIFGPMMSEYVFGYIFLLERHILEMHAHQKKKHWQPNTFRTLQNRLLGVAGLGSIGRHIAKNAKQFGMKVWGYKHASGTTDHVDRVFTGNQFNTFLAGPEYIVICLPDTPKTRHLFNRASFDVMRKEAVLINVGRGSVVSERALIEALNENRIQGAVLDVFEKEPLPEDSPLWEHPDVLVTPHVSALSFPEDIVKIFAENYRRFTLGRSLQYVIDFAKGY